MNKSDQMEVISRDAMFAAVLTGVSSYVYGTNKPLWQSMTEMRIRFLIPESINDDQDSAVAVFLLIASKHIQCFELVSEIFNKLSVRGADMEAISKIAKGIPMQENDSPEIQNLHIEQMSAMLHFAGVTNLKKGYEELDALSLEYGLNDLNEDEISAKVSA